jgi:hypothetical protein
MSAIETESDRLLLKYLEIKREICFGRKTVADMTDEEIAGSLIRLFGKDALAIFRTFPKLMRKAYRRKWPKTEEILEKAFPKCPEK